MVHEIKNIRIFILAALCLNFAITQASERRRMPVPKLRKDSSASLVVFSPLMLIGSLQGMINNIQFPHLRYNMDFSYLTKIAQENKVMLSVAASVALLALCIKQLQQSETCGAWCSEKYEKASTAVDTYTDACIKEYPLPVQAVAAPIKILMQFFCNVMKKYITMNRTTIIYATASPVLGRALDCGGVFCPFPFLNWAAVGGSISAYVCVKGYFDQSFEEIRTDVKKLGQKVDEADAKNMLLHAATQEQVGKLATKVESNIGWVKKKITEVNTRIKSILGQIGELGTSVSNIKEQLGSAIQGITNVSGEMKELKSQIILLKDNNTQQYEDLKSRFDILQKSYDQAILLLDEKSKNDEKWQQELRNDLGITATQLSNQISGVEKEVRDGFASQNRSMLPSEISSANDLRTQLLLLELGHS